MIDSLDIAEVVRRTGLSSRALRFYEARGLVKPLRTASGRRLFGPEELARLHQIIVLKAAGLSLTQMARLFSGAPMDLGQMLNAQLKILEDDKAQIEHAQSVIHFALSRIDRGEPVDAATLCSLIESGDKMMKQEPQEWAEVTARYFTPEQKAEWAAKWNEMPMEFDQEGYQQQWQDLGDRIKAAMPLEPGSEAALQFVREWFELLAPISAVSTPELWTNTAKMYEDMDSWQGKSSFDPGFDSTVWNFVSRAAAHWRGVGADIGPLPVWMKNP